MSTNLDTLKTEIEEFLGKEGFNVFHGYSRATEEEAVYWDCERHPDYREFLKAARAAGAKLVVFHRREFDAETLDEALDQLEASGVNRDDYRLTEQRLEELRRYEGFTCAVELSFDHEGRIYIYEMRAPWFEEFTTLMDDLDFAEPQTQEEDEDPMGGYFSKN